VEHVDSKATPMKNSETLLRLAAENKANLETDGKAPDCPQNQTPPPTLGGTGGKLLDEAGCPARHAALRFPDCKGNEWLDTCTGIFSKLRKDGSYSALFIGKRGPGKTQMGVHIIKYACGVLGWSCKYTKAVELLYTLKRGFDTGKAEIDSLKPYIAPQLLVIDELQEKIDGDWTRQVMTYLFDRRYDAMKSTFLIANIKCDPESIRSCVGTSIYDRLFECGEVIEFTWPSFRGREQ